MARSPGSSQGDPAEGMQREPRLAGHARAQTRQRPREEAGKPLRSQAPQPTAAGRPPDRELMRTAAPHPTRPPEAFPNTLQAARRGPRGEAGIEMEASRGSGEDLDEAGGGWKGRTDREGGGGAMARERDSPGGSPAAPQDWWEAGPGNGGEEAEEAEEE